MLQLEQEIERLRSKMIEEAGRQGSLFDDKVVALSQQLDEYIVLYQSMTRQSRAKRKIHRIELFRMPQQVPLRERDQLHGS